MKKVCYALCIAILSMGFVFSGCGKKDDSKPAKPEGTMLSVDESINKGIDFLLTTQDPKTGGFMVEVEGQKAPSPGITGLCIIALSKQKEQTPEVKAAIEKGMQFLLAMQQEDGGIYSKQDPSPPTYVTAISILAITKIGQDKYQDVVKKAQDYLAGKQSSDENNKGNYGGIGYGDDGKTANLSTTQFAIEALKESGYENDDVYKRALTFLNRCQNSSETNDMPTAGDDGGAFYSVAASKAGEEKIGDRTVYKSYGTMTYAEIKSYIYVGVSKDDPRVQKALDWVKKNYTLEVNPGMKNGLMGLFYYFHTFAKTFSILEMKEFTDASGVTHDWKKELSEKLIGMQNEDGSWVNSEPRWYENVKSLATAYAVIALDYCR